MIRPIKNATSIYRLQLSIHGRHIRIASPCRETGRERLVDALQIAFRQLHLERFRVLLEMRAAPAARNRDDVAALSQHPPERQLRRRYALLLRDLLDARDEIEILLKVLRREARVLATPVIGLQI